jgi:hypothetical protein
MMSSRDKGQDIQDNISTSTFRQDIQGYLTDLELSPHVGFPYVGLQ